MQYRDLLLLIVIMIVGFYLLLPRDSDPIVPTVLPSKSIASSSPSYPIVNRGGGSLILPHLWISDALFVKQIQTLLPDVAAIVNVEPHVTHNEAILCQSIPCLEMPLASTLHNSTEQQVCSDLDQTYQFIQQHIDQGIVLVHCQAGMNRSVVTVSYYMMRQYHWTLDQALSYIQQRRTIKPQPSLLRALSTCIDSE